MSWRNEIKNALEEAGWASADDMLDAFAHELAEKIRHHDSDEWGCGDCREESCDYFAAMIDPEGES